MNWTGGTRRRLNTKPEEKKQKQFFEHFHSEKKVVDEEDAQLSLFGESNLLKSVVTSQKKQSGKGGLDLLLLNAGLETPEDRNESVIEEPKSKRSRTNGPNSSLSPRFELNQNKDYEVPLPNKRPRFISSHETEFIIALIKESDKKRSEYEQQTSKMAQQQLQLISTSVDLLNTILNVVNKAQFNPVGPNTSNEPDEVQNQIPAKGCNNEQTDKIEEK